MISGVCYPSVAEVFLFLSGDYISFHQLRYKDTKRKLLDNAGSIATLLYILETSTPIDVGKEIIRQVYFSYFQNSINFDNKHILLHGLFSGYNT